MKGAKISVGPFAQARADMDEFCHNLYLTYAMNECALQLTKLEEEYQEAIIKDNEILAEKKRLELQVFQSSLMLTAYMFDEVDEVST
tara:strand:- start:227 stop:487 length:261 start_codon:yes stop_codon:yes gene_type:complete